jgi:hypothetical protein
VFYVEREIVRRLREHDPLFLPRISCGIQLIEAVKKTGSLMCTVASGSGPSGPLGAWPVSESGKLHHGDGVRDGRLPRELLMLATLVA